MLKASHAIGVCRRSFLARRLRTHVSSFLARRPAAGQNQASSLELAAPVFFVPRSSLELSIACFIIKKGFATVAMLNVYLELSEILAPH